VDVVVERGTLLLRCSSDGATIPSACGFMVWLFPHAACTVPDESWQVLVHVLRRVDMRAPAGGAASTSLAISAGSRGDGTSCQRILRPHCSDPLQLIVSPATLEVHVGSGGSGIAALDLTFRPRAPGRTLVRCRLPGLLLVI